MHAIIKAHDLAEPPAPWRPGPPSPKPNPTPAAPAAPHREPQLANEPDLDAERARQAGLASQAEIAREQGLAQGIRAAEQSYRAKLARLDSLSASLQQERAEFFSRIEPELVRLAVAIAEKVIQRELETEPDTVLHLLRAALKRIRDREHLRVSVNPRDFDQVKQARDDLISAVDGLRKLEIVEDRRVGPGGSLIESPSGTLDARINTQLDQISQALTEAMPAGAVDPDTPPQVGDSRPAGPADLTDEP